MNFSFIILSILIVGNFVALCSIFAVSSGEEKQSDTKAMFFGATKINGTATIEKEKSEPETMTYAELKKEFRKAEKEGRHICGYVMFKSENFDFPYSEEARTYIVSSNNKAFQEGMGGYSIFGSCLDGTDPTIRLDNYIADENGEWTVEKCWLG